MSRRDIFDEFKEHSVAEFFKKNRHMLGFSSRIRSLTTAVHEYVTNSLDACEEAGILPELSVVLERLDDDRYILKHKDNGPGIPPHLVPSVFGKLLAGTKFHRMLPTRGQQGIGAAGVTIFSQMTTGKPVRVRTSRGDGIIWTFEIKIDIKRNEPEVLKKERENGAWRGTEVTAELGEVSYNRGKHSVYEYLRRTAIANPHCQITFTDPDGKKTTYYRSSFEVVRMTKESKPHPLGITTDDLLTIAHHITKARKVSSMLKSELQCFGEKALKELEMLVNVNLNKNPKDLTWDEAKEIVAAMGKIKFRAPATDVLISIGENHIRKSLKSILHPKFIAVVSRPPKVYRGGIPFLVEVGVAYGGDIKSFELMRYANRSPLLFDQGGCVISEAIESIDWKRYGLGDIKSSPVAIFVNFVSTHVPYTSAGKQAISNIPEIFNETRQAMMEAGRKVKEFTNKLAKIEDLATKKKILEHYLPEVAKGLAKILETDHEKINKVLLEAISLKYAKLEELLAKIGDEA